MKPNDKGESRSSGRFSYDGLERVIHEKARLGILTSLVVHPDGLVFSELRDLCALTDGNLNRHLLVLQEAGLVDVWKGMRGNRPQTLVCLTDPGRKRFVDYITVLEQIVADAAEATNPAPGSAPARRYGQGWSPA